MPGNVKVVGYNGGTVVCEHEVVTPGEVIRLAFEQDTYCTPAEANYEIMITVKALDREGNPVFREDAPVCFRAEGETQIIAVDNGDLSCTDSYESDKGHLYRGQASVLLRLSGKPGRVVLWADSPEISCGQAVINISKKGKK